MLFLTVTIAIFSALPYFIASPSWPPPFIGLLPFVAFCLAVIGLVVAYMGFRSDASRQTP
jgi:hypothetical protein